jgi:NB-ARC domain
MAEAATIGALMNQLIPIAANFVKGKIEDNSESINRIKRIRVSLNEMVKQKMDILDKRIQCEGENPALNLIRLQIAQSFSLLDSIEYNIKKGRKGKTTWEPIMTDLGSLSTQENATPQPGDSVRKRKDPRDNRPGNNIMNIYEKEALELKQWMINGNGEHSVIAICGMVGVGKTTLARIAFDSVIEPKESQVKETEGRSVPLFDKKIWVSATMGYEGDTLADKIIMLVENPCKRVAEELQNDLKEKSCLIIVDDLQNITGWRWLKDILNKSTRIIITTSSKEIAHCVSKERLIQLEPLRKKKALEVFCLRAFNQHMCPIDWPESRRNSAEKIMHHCGGLPLAIVAFGDYVRELRQGDHQWESFSESPHLFMENENHILKLIYEVINLRVTELPYHLIRGLMYFSMYPSGFVFNRNRIIRLLASHNYFTESENSNWTLEQVVDKVIFKSLHDRFLLQVADQSMENAAPPHRFWIHNVVRQVLRRLSEKEYFAKSLEKSRDKIDSSNHHHVIVDEGGVVENIVDPQNLCSVSFLGQRQIPKDFCSKNPGFMLLRVLSLRNAKIEDVGDIKNLLLLHYLDLKYTNVSTCRWLKFLEELQTVDLRYTRVKGVPDACLQKLKKLRHLLLGYVPSRAMVLLEEATNDIYNWTSPFVPDELRDPLESGISYLFSSTSKKLEGAKVNVKKLQKQSMQTLWAISAPKEFDLPEIVDLFITGIKKRKTKSFWNSIEKLKNLTSLGLASDSEIELEGGKQLKHRLQKLHIQGSFSCPFKELSEFEKLSELTLALTGFKENFPIKSISTLSHLLCLKLYNVTKQKHLTFGPYGFKKLTKLVIADMKELELVKVASKIMGRLATVKLCGLPKLTGLVILETDCASDQKSDQYILKTERSDSENQSHLEFPSLKSIFLKDINHVYVISGPDVYMYNR